MPSIDPQEAAKVAEMMRSGQYFPEARKWFDAKYHFVETERSWLIIIGSVAVLCIWLCVYAMQSFLPLKPVRIYPMLVENEAEYRLSIDEIAKDGEIRNESILRFLVQDYLTVRESYDAVKLDFAQRRIRALSSDQVFQTYQQAMYAGNPESPINLYGRVIARKVQLISFVYAPSGEGYKAQVRFRATLRNKQDVPVDLRPSYWVANIAFRFTDIRVDEKTNDFTPLVFQVYDYSVAPYQP
ncbi:MAG: hypothetical protein J0L97_05685 [Alphaproteobacteria bacterium]|nr:hypothetical protein [Alphaproteobacteria bacterium]